MKGYVPGYEEIAEAAFGKAGRAVISAIIYTELFGTCCLLFILQQVRATAAVSVMLVHCYTALLLTAPAASLDTQDNMFNLFGSKLGLSPPQFMAIAAAIMIPTVWLPNLSSLSFLGVFGVAATTTVVSSVR
jgi:vesicular inhibitory amino acid transporter